jgi:adhesin HecA-like repeat protein
MKKTKILIVIAVLIVFSTTVYAKDTTFSDIKDHWAEREIINLANQDIISGYTDGTFKPDANISRSEFSTLMYRVLGLEEEVSEGKNVVFQEIEGLWSEKFIEALVEKEVIIPDEYLNGYLADEEITRVEIAKMVIRAIGKDRRTRNISTNTKFDDDENIKKEDKGYIYLAEYYGIISGYPDNTFRPNGLATRAEAVKMLINQQKAVKKMNKPSSKSYADAKVQFTLPQYTHTDKEVKIEVTTENVKELTWKLEKQDENGEMIEVEFETPLSTTGGVINFPDKGTYKLTAQATNYGNRKFEFSESIKVYPIPKATFALGAYAHTDSKIDVITNIEELGELDIVWSLEKEGQDIALAENLSNDGGTITLKEKGNYTLTAAITDEVGRVFEYNDSIEIYPIITASFDLPENTHTDSNVNVVTALHELGSNNIVWALEKEGKAVDLATYLEESLDNNGGTVRFKDRGKYTLKATVTDEIGRVFESEDKIEVYPVITAKFDLPENTHTDSNVDIVTYLQELSSNNIVWSLEKDDQAVDLKTYLERSLDNNGGTVKFNEKGNYTLKATVMDEIGRAFEFKDSIEIYPIITVNFELPQTAHTDSNVNVVTALQELGSNNIVWTLEKEGKVVDLATYLEESLDNNGGTVRFKEKGKYTLKATVTDEVGRAFEFEDSIEVYPIITASFDLPEAAHTDSNVNVVTALNELGSNNVEWILEKEGKAVDLATYLEGSLDNNGGIIRFKDKGKYTLKATVIDGIVRAFVVQDTVEIYPIPKISISIPDSLHIGSEFNLITSPTDLGDLNVVWSLSKDNQSVSLSSYLTGTLTNNGGNISFNQIGNYTLVGTITDSTNRLFTYSDTVSVTNNPPSTPSITANVTREISNGKFKVNLNIDSTDPDGDTVTYEYVGKTADNYYPVGSHTVKVRAKDSYGLYSEWASVNFNVANNPPTVPVITRTPNGNSVPPNTSITITASSNDPDGDDITYVWEGRVAETGKYPLGKNVVKVKVVDEAGAESPQSAIVFFVADSQNGGGMVLTGRDSTIIEQGIEGASIVKYTFTVPPVSGHSGSDHGRIKGYNPVTDSWEQIDIEHTRNGVTMSGTLEKGKYTKLEFYYYTNHNCMYNKSNITYSVEYYFK